MNKENTSPFYETKKQKVSSKNLFLISANRHKDDSYYNDGQPKKKRIHSSFTY